MPPPWRAPAPHAGGASRGFPSTTTEGGWLHIETSALVDDALAAKERGFGGSKIKIGRPHVSEDVARLEAVRKAVGPAFEIMTDANQRFTVDEAIRRARCLTPIDIAWLEEPLTADDLMGHVRLSQSTTLPVAIGECLYSHLHFRNISSRAPAPSCRSMWHVSAASRPG